LDYVKYDTPAGTLIALLVQEGGTPVAYGKISASQPSTLGKIRIKTPHRNQLLIDIDTIVSPSAAVALHCVPSQTPLSSKRTKAGSYTLQQIQRASGSEVFQVVAQLSHLEFDRCSKVSCLHFLYLTKFLLLSRY